MPTRASDSSKFTRWDGDPFRGGNLTHPGIVENGVLVMVVPRTNLGGATSKREQDFGSDGRRFESLRARHNSLRQSEGLAVRVGRRRQACCDDRPIHDDDPVVGQSVFQKCGARVSVPTVDLLAFTRRAPLAEFLERHSTRVLAGSNGAPRSMSAKTWSSVRSRVGCA